MNWEITMDVLSLTCAICLGQFIGGLAAMMAYNYMEAKRMRDDDR